MPRVPATVVRTLPTTKTWPTGPVQVVTFTLSVAMRIPMLGGKCSARTQIAPTCRDRPSTAVRMARGIGENYVVGVPRPRRRAIRRRVPRWVGIAVEPSLDALQSPLVRRGLP
jgi:hypothetical protein